MAQEITIKLMNGSASFSETTTSARNVSELKEKLSIPSGTVVNVNGVADTEGTTELSNDDYVAIVRDNKTGGTIMLVIKNNA